GPSAFANVSSTNHGIVRARSFNAPPKSASPSSRTNSFQRAGSARNDGTDHGAMASARSAASADDAGSSAPPSRMRHAARTGPTASVNTRPANGASLSRAHCWSASIRLTRRAGASPASGHFIQLLDSGQEPTRRTVHRLREVPDFLEFLRQHGAILAQQAFELDADPMAIA